MESDNDGKYVVYIVDPKYGKSSTYEFNADLELLLKKLFLHLGLANGVTSNPAKLCSWSIQLIQAMKLLNQNNKSNLLYKFAHTSLLIDTYFSRHFTCKYWCIGDIRMLQRILSIYFIYCNFE